jgi:hypothetical protein
MSRRLSKKRMPKKGGVKRKTRRGGQPGSVGAPRTTLGEQLQDRNAFDEGVQGVQEAYQRTQYSEVAAQAAQKAREKAAAKGSSRRRRYRR